MKRYWKESLLFLLQILLFYVFPLTCGPTDAIGMVLLIICGTFLLSLLMGILSGQKVKFLYPFATSLIFLPSIPIYYNDSALIHGLWYFVIAAIGLCIGAFIHWIAGKCR